MKEVEQIYTNCLAQGAYFIESDGEAAVIDPLRETEPYLQRAERLGVKIKYIFETHFHADFVSGHVDLAKKTGATIIYGPTADTKFDIHNATDGEEFKIGKIKIKAIHTPGHTPESTTYLLIDENQKEKAIFTGDTLFIGDVGRPDLAQKSGALTVEDLAGWLYDSLRNKIMVLPDDVIVYPAHGQGSACGKNMSSDTWSTLGEQKKTNYALRASMTKEEFIVEVTDGLQAPPQYFPKNAKLNKLGYDSFDEVLERGNKALSVRDFKLISDQEDVLILDVRSKEDFVEGFIPGSWFIGLDGSFAPWVGTMIKDIMQKIVIVAPVGKELETIKRLARVGYDNAIGYLDGGFKSWADNQETINTIETIDANTFLNLYEQDSSLSILDVRKPGEFSTKHINQADNFPLDFIHENIAEFNGNRKYYMHCRSGYRSTVAASILMEKGFSNFVNVQCMFADFENTPLELAGNCPSLVK